MNDVIWDEAARDQLADIWVAATPADRERIEAAVHQLNRSLAADPHGEGESRGSSTRVTIELPLTVWYRVNDETGTVVIYHVVRPARR